MVKYEYKCVAGPTELVVKSQNEASIAVASYADLINEGAQDGWEFYSMESMTVSQAPGCFSKDAPPIIFNMLIFRRQVSA